MGGGIATILPDQTADQVLGIKMTAFNGQAVIQAPQRVQRTEVMIRAVLW